MRYALVQMDESCTGGARQRAEYVVRALAHSGAVVGSNAAYLPRRPYAAVAGATDHRLSVSGAERSLYIGGKALQLAALTVAQCISETEIFQAQQFSSRDIDRIRGARDILIAEMREPPSLNVLAQRVGLNVRKLTLGFRHVFGATVFGFLQEHRLETAYKLLAAGEMSVSEAATTSVTVRRISPRFSASVLDLSSELG